MKKFYTEQQVYEKTSLSELQGAWENFKTTLLKQLPFENSDKIIFHMNEAMSWKVVRDLHEMKNIYMLIRNIIIKTQQYETLVEELNEIKFCLDDALEEYGK
jgi:hypothetical protein